MSSLINLDEGVLSWIALIFNKGASPIISRPTGLPTLLWMNSLLRAWSTGSAIHSNRKLWESFIIQHIPIIALRRRLPRAGCFNWILITWNVNTLCLFFPVLVVSLMAYSTKKRPCRKRRTDETMDFFFFKQHSSCVARCITLHGGWLDSAWATSRVSAGRCIWEGEVLHRCGGDHSHLWPRPIKIAPLIPSKHCASVVT